MSALDDLFPRLTARAPRASLAVFPSPVEECSSVLRAAGLGGELWLKRDDACSEVCGGNKVRLLEYLLGRAKARGVARVYSSGAKGSNFALATALHAPRVGLEAGAICFPEMTNPEGEASHRVVCARAQVVEVAHWSLLPLASERVRRQSEARGVPALVMSQVTFEPEALFGYVAAGLELALQVSSGACPMPARIVLPIGSAATSAGIAAGLALSQQLGIVPRACAIEAVRIAPWPLSRRGRVLKLAERALARLAELVEQPKLSLGSGALPQLSVVTNQLGAGYPHPTPAGARARALFASSGLPILDDTYSAKAAAHLLASVGDAPGPVLFWCTKSSATLPT
jgi:D-cysteine desulfhydrase